MFKNSKLVHQISYQGQNLKLETGLLAQQATASVVATLGETTVMANVMVGAKVGMDYFPLQVIYEEKMYASGKIHGSRFVKREGRPSDNAILTGRMIDRSIRSLFDSHIRNEIQIIITVLSVDEINSPDVLSVMCASAALGLCGFSSDMYSGPISTVRIGMKVPDIGKHFCDEAEKLVAEVVSFESLEPFLLKISECLHLDIPAERECIKQIAKILSDKNVDWAKDFSRIYKTTTKLQPSEVLQRFPQKPDFIINPSYKAQDDSLLDLVVSGNGQDIMMVEAGANIVAEEVINQGLLLANQELENLTEFQKEFIDKAKSENLYKEIKLETNQAHPKYKVYWKHFKNDLELALYYPGSKDEKAEKLNLFKKEHLNNLQEMITLFRKLEIKNTNQAHQFLVEHINGIASNSSDIKVQDSNLNLQMSQTQIDLLVGDGENLELNNSVNGDLNNSLDEVIKDIVQEKILFEEKRVDGRKINEVRPILIEINPLPRVHGSSLFQRGETQVLNILTLGTARDAQVMDQMEDFQEDSKRYIHHYNFPSYSVGETGRYGPPGRREIGHGALAEKALLPVLPSESEFPYTMRLVSECLGSNGSTSMASTCASTLSLLDGGVPIKDLVAGVAMGLVVDNKTGNFKVLTDIQGLEDHHGDMDFKVTGTKNGITAIQLDNKIAGLTVDILQQALLAAKEGRLFILQKMKSVIEKPRENISKYAPQVLSVDVPVDKIGEIIGPGGRVIKSITQKYDVEIDIEDNTGKTFIFGKDADKVHKAQKLIINLIKGYEVGDLVSGRVFRIENFGAFVKILEDGDENGKEAMIHISNLAKNRIKRVEDVVNIGDLVDAKVHSINDKGQIDLVLLSKSAE
jgi:polyribonucleotide nucleotidyltransferase